MGSGHYQVAGGDFGLAAFNALDPTTVKESLSKKNLKKHRTCVLV